MRALLGISRIGERVGFGSPSYASSHSRETFTLIVLLLNDYAYLTTIQ